MSKLRVWHIPQVPMKAFKVEVSSVEEGVRMMDALADYDAFQYENNVKPDYCNANGLQMYDESLTDQDLIDMELDDRWTDWYNDEYDDPREYINDKSQSA
ncbi:superinfection exclusion protein [Pectobacterium zantedeschiae]|uniref:superinfection exclusion protein n=1 Tax=Pectobacterium zantedeschiae TaxID=2034769 RepID=UPI0032EDEC4F